MADEGGLQYIIGVAVDNEGVGAQLDDVVSQADRMAQRVNQVLEGLGAVPSFEGLVAGAEKGRVSLESVVEAANLAKTSISEAADAVAQINSLGVGAKVSGVADIQRLITESEKYLAIQRELAASGGIGAPNLRTTASNRTQNTDTGKLVSAADAQATVQAFEQEGAALKQVNDLLGQEMANLREVLAINDQITAAQAEQRAGGAALSTATRAAEALPPPTPRLQFQDQASQLAYSIADPRSGAVGISDPDTITAALKQLGFTAAEAKDALKNLADAGVLTPVVTSADEAAAAIDRVAASIGAVGELNPTATQAQIAQLRAIAANEKLANLPDEASPGAQASVLAGSLGADLKSQETNAALERQGQLQKDFNTLLSAGVELTKVELAQMKLLTAELALAEASERGVESGSSLGNRLQTNVLAQQKAVADAQAAATASGGDEGGGFFGGVRNGLTGGTGGGAEELGNQVAQVAKFTALYQGFRLIEDSIKTSISEMLDFERGVTNLSLQLGISRDSARDLATNLGNIAAANGLAPSQGAALGSQYAGVFAGEDTATNLATQGATYGSQLALVSGSGKDASTDLADATATVKAFNLTSDDTSRVLDAASTAAQHFLGSIDPSAVLPGLAQIGDLAQSAGLSLEQTANLLADVQSRTGDTSDAAAGELRRVLGREAQPAFQAVFAQTGIDTTLPFQQELAQLSAKYDTLSDKQKAYIANQFGGARAGAAAVATIEDYAKVQDEANKSTQEGGAFQEAATAKLNDLKGVLTSLGGEAKNLAKDFGETGVFSGLGIALELLKPGVETIDELLQQFNKIPAPIRDVVFALGEVALALKLINGESLLGGLSKIPVIGGSLVTGSARGAAATAGTEAGLAGGVAAGEAGATDAAAAAAAASVEAANVRVAAALDALGTEATATVDEITAINVELADAVTALGVAVDELTAVDIEIAADETGLGLSSLGAGLGIAAIGVIAFTQALSASKAQNKDIAASNNLNVTGTTSDDLRNSGSALANAATKDRQSSAGIVGSFTNEVRSHFDELFPAVGIASKIPGLGFLGDGESTTDAANRASKQASLANYEAQQLDKATSSASDGSLGSLANQIDLSTSGGITQGLSNLKASGADATQQLDALHEKLTDFANAAAGGANVLAKGESLILAQQIANTTTNQIGTFAQIDVDAKNSGATAGAKVLKGDQQGLNSAIDTATSNYLTSQGLDQGGAITPAQEKAAQAAAIEAVKTYLASPAGGSLSKKDIQAELPNIQLATASATKNAFADANAVAGQTLTPDETGQVVADAPGLIQEEQQSVGTKASLSGDSQGGSLAGANAGLARAQELYNDLVKSGADAQTLKPLADEIAQLQLAAQQALLQHLAGLSALAESAVSPFDKAQDIAVQISGIEQQLSVATDADTRNALQIKLNQLEQQQAAQAVSDANAARDAGIASGDAVGKATTALEDAQADLQAIVATGVTTGQAYSEALQKVNDARQAAIDAQVTQIGDLSTSQIDPRQTQALDQNSLSKINFQLANTPQFGADGQQTSQYSQLVTQQKAAQLKILSDNVSEADAIEKANSDGTNPLQQLQVQLDAVVRNLQTIDVGDPTKTATDISAAKALQVQIVQRTIDEANAIQDAARDPRDLILGDQQQVGQDKTQIANDGGDAKKRADDEAKLKADRAKEAQDLVSQANEQRDAGVRSGDPLAAAEAALADAQGSLSLDLKGQGLYFQHLAAVNAAEAALSSTIADHAKEEALLAGDTTDPVASALADLAAARVKLAEDKARKTGDLDADQLAVETAAQAAQKAQFDQTFALQQTAYSLHEESATQYLSYLQSQDSSIRKQLAGMKKGQEGYQQLVDELNTIDGAIQGLDDQLQGQFNLGDIKLPTVYEVRRSVAATAAGQAIDASSVTNVNVEINGADFAAVVNYMNGVLGGRGATATVATTGRKAA